MVGKALRRLTGVFGAALDFMILKMDLVGDVFEACGFWCAHGGGRCGIDEDVMWTAVAPRLPSR